MIYLMRVVLLAMGLCCISISIEAASEKTGPRVCLNMIVKDESTIICRCLSSVLPLIDHWVIVDTGSTDGTQKIIADFMAQNKIPGELHERPWINFGHNRNEALDLARDKGDYILFMDADNYLTYEPDFKLPALEKDCYHVLLADAGTTYSRLALIKAALDSKWVGVLHEAVCCPQIKTQGNLEKVRQIVLTDGNRSKDPKKYEKDAAIFEEALKKEPNNSRYVFYLAQSYHDAGNYPLALKHYERRVSMGGWDQEVFWSLLKIGQLQEMLEMPSETIVRAYKNAYHYRSTRIEPLYYLVRYYSMLDDFKKGYEVSKIAESVPKSEDNLFVQAWIYDYGMALERSVCAYWLGKYKECQQLSKELLAKELPPHIRLTVERNLGFANTKLLETIDPLEEK